MPSWVSVLSVATSLNFLLKTLVILVGCLIAIRLIRLLSDQYRKFVISHRPDGAEDESRVTTVLAIFKSALSSILFVLASLLILNELGINIAPLIAGAGVLGVAVAFGTQSLVKDVFYGFFILAENQFGLGDRIQVGGQSGLVERMTFRMVKLRDADGRLHIIPNGEITKVTVLPKAVPGQSLQMEVDLPLIEIDPLLAAVQQVCLQAMQETPTLFTEAPVLLQLTHPQAEVLHLKFMLKTPPQDQWKGFEAFRDRLNQAFLSLPGAPVAHFSALLPGVLSADAALPK